MLLRLPATAGMPSVLAPQLLPIMTSMVSFAVSTLLLSQSLPLLKPPPMMTLWLRFSVIAVIAVFVVPRHPKQLMHSKAAMGQANSIQPSLARSVNSSPV